MTLWRYSLLAVSLVSLSFFLRDNRSKRLEYSVSSQEEKKKMLQQLDQEQVSSESKSHSETFKEMQRRSPVLQLTSYQVLAGALPQEKKLLTVGISSVQRPHGSTLLHTLQSLFQASSESELDCIVVLVHLSDPDPAWRSQMVANISDLFQPHLEAQKLLVIHGHLGGSLVPGDRGNINASSPCEAVYSRQKVNYALLMNFAVSLSEYFLMVEDHVGCAPKFVSTIYWALAAWTERPWVTLEFSSLSFSGKVFHSSDLSRLTTFLLLFPKDTPTHLLLSEFRLLLAQHVPIRFSPSVFSPTGNYSAAEDTCFPVEKEVVFGDPDNPVASVLTDMRPIPNVIPQYAYFLNTESYVTLDALRGNYLVVVLERPQKVVRIEVLTGADKQGQYRLQQGQVELGYDPWRTPKAVRYTVLGPLVQGNLDQRVFYEEGAVEQLSCIRLLVLASQDSWLFIRQIRVWTQPEEEEGWGHTGDSAGTGLGNAACMAGRK